jgi:hypothetical protein
MKLIFINNLFFVSKAFKKDILVFNEYNEISMLKLLFYILGSPIWILLDILLLPIGILSSFRLKKIE